MININDDNNNNSNNNNNNNNNNNTLQLDDFHGSKYVVKIFRTLLPSESSQSEFGVLADACELHCMLY